MPEDKLGARQRAVMFVLMVEGSEISNPEMKRRYQLDLTGKALTDLHGRDLVKGTKGFRGAWVHELTDKGWLWCNEELGESAPANPGSLGRAMYAMLPKLGRYLDANGLSLADVFGPDSLEDRIRAAYARLAKDPGDYVSLTDLRRGLNGATRAEVDEALLALNRDPSVIIAPNDDQESMSTQDRAAALRIGGQDNHLLSIGPA